MTAVALEERPLRVLIVSYGFPPSQAVGHIRVGKLAKYLVRGGCDVRVVTSHPDCLPFPALLDVEVPEEAIVRVRFGGAAMQRQAQRGKSAEPAPKNGWRSRLLPFARRVTRSVPRPNYSRLPDLAAPWYAPAEQAAARVIHGWLPDVLFSSSGPSGAHIVTSRLARRFRLPWVADFRDLWTNNPIVTYPRWLDRLERSYERAVLRPATHIVTVSDPLAEQLRRTHRKPVSVVFNGYDPEDFAEARVMAQPFVLTYTGQADPGTRDPEPLFAALALLAQRGAITPDGLLIRFIGGTRQSFLQELADRHGVRQYLDMTDSLPYQRSIRCQQESAALLMLNIAVPDSPGMLSGKLVEYLGARRPILAIGPEDPAVSAVLRETGAGEWAGSPAEIAGVLERWIERHRAGALAVQGTSGALAPYSRATQGAQLADILRAASVGPIPLGMPR